jgi:hypothetical protein
MSILKDLRVPELGGVCHDCGIALDQQNQVTISSPIQGKGYFYSLCKKCYAQRLHNRSDLKKHTHVFIQNGKAVKKCADCGKVLPVSHYGSDTSKRDGIKSSCKECAARREKERREKARQENDGMTFREAPPEEYLVNLICQRITKIISPIAEDVKYLRQIWKDTKSGSS